MSVQDLTRLDGRPSRSPGPLRRIAGRAVSAVFVITVTAFFLWLGVRQFRKAEGIFADLI